jgi:lipoprotein-anchoring transpeptidase ErfK/SrfK
MPRLKALSALAFLAVLISAGSVGSQDPLRARSEAESAASAVPISAPDPTDPAFNPHIVTSPQHLEISRRTSAQPLQLAVSGNGAIAHEPSVAPTPVTAVQPASVAPMPPLSDRLLMSDPTVPTDASAFTVAERRLFATVPDDIEPYFDLFMYVSKSNRGPLAQQMYVFQRDGDGKIIPYASWQVSTGREKIELHRERRVRTTTPEGIFALNPKRLHKRYWSTSWDGAPMHYAMFYDLMNNGHQSGLAIHAAVGRDKIRRLGRRDSAGCIRLLPKHAKELFYKVRNTTQGRVPVLAVNARGSTDRWGGVQYDEAGAMKLQDGYRALVFVENYDGRDELVSPVVAYTQ